MNKIQQIVQIFETGTLSNRGYGTVTVAKDGQNGALQISYGIFQITEFGNLKELLQSYIDVGGRYARELLPYMGALGTSPSKATDLKFRHILFLAGGDTLMHACQDRYFYGKYFKPAETWAKRVGFKTQLALLVVYDSYIHSGGMPTYLLNRVKISTSNEKEFIKEYVNVRHAWLANHSKKILNNCIYRTETFKHLIANDDWELTKVTQVRGVKLG